MNKRVFLIVLDSCGVGALPDAEKYGDDKCNTLGNLSRAVGGLYLSNLERLGLGNIINIDGVENVGKNAAASWGKAAEVSSGKDTTTGHYEITGLIVEKPFPTYPNGFPHDLISKFCEVNNFEGVLGNKAASGTEIIYELGDEHIKTKLPIVYTSQDSVFQIAAHEDVINPEELWKICRRTRSILNKPHNISRVIARPFIGESGSYIRTSNRRDFTQDPPDQTLLDILKENGHAVYGIGKIEDIFNGRGLTKSIHTDDNSDGIIKTLDAIKEEEEGLIFTNLVDFDMKYGHRNDPDGYAEALKEFDSHLDDILTNLRDSDLLLITADHGCDPTYKESTDHSREYVPILIYSKFLNGGKDLNVRKTFADIGKTIADYFDIGDELGVGESFLDK